MIPEPRTTYVTPDTPPDERQVYWDTATAALKRCTPLQFTDGLGGALAGRPGSSTIGLFPRDAMRL